MNTKAYLICEIKRSPKSRNLQEQSRFLLSLCRVVVYDCHIDCDVGYGVYFLWGMLRCICGVVLLYITRLYYCGGLYSPVVDNKIRKDSTKNQLFPVFIQLYKLPLLYCHNLNPSHTLRGDKVSTLTHTYPHKPLRKNKVTMCNHQTDCPLCVA